MPSPPKVLIIPSWYPTAQNPLAGSFFQEQAQLLSRNFDIKVLFGEAKQVSKLDFNIAKLKMRLKKRVVSITPLTHPPPEMWTFQYPQNKTLSEEKNTFMMFQCYLEAFKILSLQWIPDVLHAHCVRFGGMISNYISRATHLPYIITEHAGGEFWLEDFNQFKNEQMALAYEAATLVTAVSHSKIREILAMGFRCKPIAVGNYINEDLFPISVEKNTKSSFQLLTVANEPINKDLETLFAAFNLLIEFGNNDISLNVIGISPEKNEYIKSLLDQFPLILPHVSFVQYADRTNMPFYYQQCDVFLSTSISESFGIAVAEAIICGKPVVVTRSGGIDDIVDGSNGLKVHIRDYQALAEAILRLKDREITFDAQKARQGIIDKFGTEAFLDRMTKVYQQAIK